MADQVRTTGVTTAWIMRRAAFMRGVEDISVRARMSLAISERSRVAVLVLVIR